MSNRRRSPDPPWKTCVACGRRMEWRRRWARNWDDVKYCSAACRARGQRPEDRRLEEAIVALLARRGSGSTLCPSEVARRAYPDRWREHMETVRAAGRRLASRDVVVFRQKGRTVDPSTARGPVRLGRGTSFSGARSRPPAGKRSRPPDGGGAR